MAELLRKPGMDRGIANQLIEQATVLIEVTLVLLLKGKGLLTGMPPYILPHGKIDHAGKNVTTAALR